MNFVKGPQGGYFLADNPRKLRIADIVLALDRAYTLEQEAGGRKGTGDARALAVQNEQENKIDDRINWRK